jgi:hypothetical protein
MQSVARAGVHTRQSRAYPSHDLSFRIRTAHGGRTWAAWGRASPSPLASGEMRGRLCQHGRVSVVGTTDDPLSGQRCFVARSSACCASAMVTGSGGVWSAFRHSKVLTSRRRFHAKWTVVVNPRARRLATHAASRAHAIRHRAITTGLGMAGSSQQPVASGWCSLLCGVQHCPDGSDRDRWSDCRVASPPTPPGLAACLLEAADGRPLSTVTGAMHTAHCGSSIHTPRHPKTIVAERWPVTQQLSGSGGLRDSDCIHRKVWTSY